MAKYRKKPVVIEAFRWTGGIDQTDDPQWAVEAMAAGSIRIGPGPTLLIETLEGTMQANPGDYIIQGVKGEIYPCKPDIFDATYDHVHGPDIRVHSLNIRDFPSIEYEFKLQPEATPLTITLYNEGGEPSVHALYQPRDDEIGFDYYSAWL